MKTSSLYRYTYIYLGIPLFLFCLTWMRLEVGVPLAILYSIAFYFSYPKNEEQKINISRETWLFIITIATVWCFCAGIGYFYYQSFDYHFRNAVFRDLIAYDWPVYYDMANTPLVYYMAFWLVVALIGKFLLFLGCSLNVAFYVANVFLLIYAIIGTILIFCHIIKAVNAKNFKNILIAILAFIFFS